MNFLKSQSYNFTPDQYLEKFKTPHQIINSKGNNELDQKDNQVLNTILSKYRYDDNSESSALRERIVTELGQIVMQWIKDINTKNNSIIDLEGLGYGLKVFGSYSLKTNSYDGDIDMLCIVPDYINRQTHFFKVLVDYLRKHQQIKQIFPIPDAIVPLIRLSIYGIQIDLLQARIKQTFMIDNPHFFQSNIDSSINIPIQERELRSINGYRTALLLQNKYVDKYKNYRTALKAIKLWAKNKGIYSQVYGYLGGAAFSIMLAKICQLYPKYSTLQLLDRFFFIYANWVWAIPVIIQKMDYMQKLQSEMVIFTPLDPHMNAGHYITKNTSNITKRQFKLASKLILEINKDKKHWEDLFQPFNFFKQYRNFIEISVMGQQIEDYVPWKGNVQSKIRKFIQNLQQNQYNGIQVNPFPQAFTSKHSNFKYCSRYYIGLKCSTNSIINDDLQIDLTLPVRNFLQLFQTYPQIDKAPKLINIGMTYLSIEQIPSDVIQEFNQNFGKKQ